MKMRRTLNFALVGLLLLQLSNHVQAQEKSYGRFVTITPGTAADEVAFIAGEVTPSFPQYAWQQLEFTAFAHFGMNTFTDREWGEGTEDPALFNPTEFDARQWVKVFHDAGMHMLIIVAKHHDGFCYWPSKYTNHSVKKSPWKKGKGDIVKELTDACHEYGLKVGIYLSPWDRHEESYGDSPEYNKFFINQLKELLTNYGTITEVWFDGACGEGPNGKRQEYDWPAYYKTIRELQPGAVIFGMGPDIRWVGTETGIARETEWSVVPIKLKSSQSGKSVSLDDLYIPGDMTEEDLGSKEKISNVQALIWYPAEADVSIRPGWFYHSSEDDKVKTPEQLVELYFKSVGRNSVLLLNVPADKRGLLHENDIRSLMGMRSILNQTFSKNLAEDGVLRYYDEHTDRPYFVTSNQSINWESNSMSDTSILQLSLPFAKTFDVLCLQESIKKGQRIAKFRLEVLEGEQWKTIAQGTTVGYKRLITFQPVTTSEMRLVIEESRSSATLIFWGLYKTPSIPAFPIKP